MGAEEAGTLPLTEAERAGISWIKAQASTAYGECIEVASAAGKIAIRDSKDPDGLILIYSPDKFREFTDGARNGKFDGLAQRFS